MTPPDEFDAKASELVNVVRTNAMLRQEGSAEAIAAALRAVDVDAAKRTYEECAKIADDMVATVGKDFASAIAKLIRARAGEKNG